MALKISLRSARANVNMSAKEVAEQIGVEFQTLLRWEKGEHQPPIDKILQLCELYGIKVENINWRVE